MNGTTPSEAQRATAARPVRAMIFDFNGVIIDDEHLHFLAFQKTLAERGHAIEEPEYLARYLGLDDRGFFTRALADRGEGLAPDAIWALVEKKALHYEAELEGHMRLVDGAVDLVRDAATRVPLAIASGARRREIELVVARAGIAQCFSAIVSADEVARGKPAPDGYLAALALLQKQHPSLDAASCLVVEDAVNGVRAAHAAGMRAVALTSSLDAAALAEADLVVDSLVGASLPSLVARLRPAS